MVITIHQPEHMPWLGFFNKAANSDVFVLLDSVQYRKDYFQNRNQILSKDIRTAQWITVPVSKGSQKDLICQKKIRFDIKSKRKYLRQIHETYNNHLFYEEVMPTIQQIFENENEYLSKLNISLIQYFFTLLGIRCKTIVSSELSLGDIPTGGVINYHICKKLNASAYLSGISGKEYLNEEPFKEQGISVFYQDFKHPKYAQGNDLFVSNLSVLDLIFSFPPDKCLEIIKSGYSL